MAQKQNRKSVTTEIPWQEPGQWQQAVDSIKRVADRAGQNIDQARQTALQIQKRYEDMAAHIDGLCSICCPSCTDICCVRATIWFDFRDLLCLYFSTGDFPEKQITRTLGQDGTACSCLKPEGCSLPRDRRPFVCTWYFCPEQIAHLSQTMPESKRLIDNSLAEIKHLRRQLEDEFIRAAAGKSPK